MSKKKKKKKQSPVSGGLIINAFKGATAALIVTVGAILALALVIKEAQPDESVIAAADQIIKVASIFISAFIASKHAEKPAICGSISGLIYVLLGFAAFSIVEGSAGDLSVLAADSAMGIGIGALVGLIFGKLLKKATPSRA